MVLIKNKKCSQNHRHYHHHRSRRLLELVSHQRSSLPRAYQKNVSEIEVVRNLYAFLGFLQVVVVDERWLADSRLETALYSDREYAKMRVNDDDERFLANTLRPDVARYR